MSYQIIGILNFFIVKIKINSFKRRYFCSTSCTARDVLILRSMEVLEEQENLNNKPYLHIPEEQTFVLQSKSLRFILSGIYSFYFNFIFRFNKKL